MKWQNVSPRENFLGNTSAVFQLTNLSLTRGGEIPSVLLWMEGLFGCHWHHASILKIVKSGSGLWECWWWCAPVLDSLLTFLPLSASQISNLNPIRQSIPMLESGFTFWVPRNSHSRSWPITFPDYKKVVRVGFYQFAGTQNLCSIAFSACSALQTSSSCSGAAWWFFSPKKLIVSYGI